MEDVRNVRSRTNAIPHNDNGLMWATARFCTVPELTRLAWLSRTHRRLLRQSPEWWAGATWSHTCVPPPHAVRAALAACPGLAHLPRARLHTAHLSQWCQGDWDPLCDTMATALQELEVDCGPQTQSRTHDHYLTRLSKRAARNLCRLLARCRALRAYAGPLPLAMGARGLGPRLAATLRALDVRMHLVPPELLEAALRRLPALRPLRVRPSSAPRPTAR